jgi:hypothetical protein
MTRSVTEQRERRLARTRGAELVAAVARRLEEDPSLATTLRLLVDPESPTAAPTAPARALAAQVNAERLAERRAAFARKALTTPQVQEVLGGVTRQAVAQRVANGGLLSLEIAGRSYFPDWQFGRDGVLPGLRDLLDLRRVDARGALGADAVMRTPIEEERGRTPADLLRRGDLERARHYVSTAF